MADADSLRTPFVPTSRFAYSCQTVLAIRVNEFLHPSHYHCWFSLTFNPSSGGNSSNPLWLYGVLSHAVQTNDINDAKVQLIRTALMEAVTRSVSLTSPAGSTAAAQAIVNIRHAAIEMFRPQIWAVDLAKVGPRASSGHQYPDERKIVDLKWHEFEVIVE